MKLIIDIPESIYETIESNQFITRFQLAVLQSNIRKGVSLPKGHGRLIDVSEYFKKEFGDAREFLDNAMTIIEADTESEDKT